MTLAMRFVLFAVDLARYGLPLQATRSQRARRTRFGIGLITPPNALARTAWFVGRHAIRQRLSLRAPVAIARLVVDDYGSLMVKPPSESSGEARSQAARVGAA